MGADSNGKQYLVMYENQSHFQTLGPFNEIEGFYITPDGYSWGMRYSSSYDSGYYREGKRGGFSHASIALLKKDGKKEIFSLVYLDKVTNKNRQIYRIRVNEIKQPYKLEPIEPAWATSHTPNVGYQKVLQIGDQDFCKDSSEPEIERVCIKGLKSSKIAALRLFFKRLGLERGKTDL